MLVIQCIFYSVASQMDAPSGLKHSRVMVSCLPRVDSFRSYIVRSKHSCGRLRACVLVPLTCCVCNGFCVQYADYCGSSHRWSANVRALFVAQISNDFFWFVLQRSILSESVQ